MMSFGKKRETPLDNITRNLYTVIAVVLIWRGVWIILDRLDLIFFGGSHAVTAALGIIVGILMLYARHHHLNDLL